MAEKSNKRQFDVEFKKSVVRKLESGSASWRSIMKEYSISKETLTGWVIKYGNQAVSEADTGGESKVYDETIIREVVECYKEGKLSMKDIALKYRVSCGTIRNWAKRYDKGIARSKYASYWTPVMVEYLKKNYPKRNTEEVARELGLKVSSVLIKAKVIGLKKESSILYGVGRHVEWTPEMIDYLKAEFPTATGKTLAEKLNLSETAISRKAKQLGLVKDPEFAKASRGRMSKNGWLSEFQKQHDWELQKERERYDTLKKSYDHLDAKNKELSDANLLLQRRISRLENELETLWKLS